MKQKEAFEKFLNTKFIVPTSQSNEVQEKLFSIGYKWPYYGKVITLMSSYVSVDKFGLLDCMSSDGFLNSPEQEIAVEEILNVQIDDEPSCQVFLPEEPKALRIETTTIDDKWVFEGGKKEAPFYMVYVDGGHGPTKMHDTMQAATEEADRLAKINNRRTYILAGCMMIEPEVITHGTMIMDMKEVK